MIRAICESVKSYFKVLLKLFPFLLLVYLPTAVLLERYPEYWKLWAFVNLIPVPAIYFATYDCKDGKKFGWAAYVKKSFANFLWMVGVDLLIGLVLLGLALCLVIPAFIGFVYIQFAADCFFRLGIRDAWQIIKVSFKMVKGHWWATVWFEFVCICIAAFAFIALYIIWGCFSACGESDPTFSEKVIGSVWLGFVWVFVLVSGRVWFMHLEKLAKTADSSDSGVERLGNVGVVRVQETEGTKEKTGLFADWRKSRIGVIPNLIIYIVWPLAFLVAVFKFHAFIRHCFPDSFLDGVWLVNVLWLIVAIVTMWYNGKKYCRDYVYGNVLRFLITFIVGCMIYGTFFK